MNFLIHHVSLIVTLLALFLKLQRPRNRDILLSSTKTEKTLYSNRPQTCLPVSAVGKNDLKFSRIDRCSEFWEDTEIYKGTTRIDTNM